ncbi:endonuclease domain-containing protein [Geodermatophilus sp. SYSU D01176]
MPTPRVPPPIRRPTDRAGARAEGVTDWQLRHLEVVRSSRNTYLPAATADDVRTRVTAVLLGAPAAALLSHRTAAALWGLQIPLVPADHRIHLTVPPGTRIRSRADRQVHCAHVPEWQIVRRGDVALTSPGRTWRDLAAVLPAAALLAVTDQMLARRYPSEAFQRVLDTARGLRGVRTARAVLSVADALAGSPMESVARWIVHEAGLPAPVLQHVVRGGRGEFLGRVDMAWPEHRVLLEFDGDVHRERRVFVDDLRRQNRLVLAGWVVLRFTSADLVGRPAWVAATIKRALAGS